MAQTCQDAGRGQSNRVAKRNDLTEEYGEARCRAGWRVVPLRDVGSNRDWR